MDSEILLLDNTAQPYRNVKDSVFKSLFGDPQYLYQLYRALYPEDEDTKVEDLKLITLETVIVKDIHNDLGFLVGDRLIVLAEAQSRWDKNIAIRSLFYLCRSYQNYLNETGQSLFDATPVKLPRAELYVIYTGEAEITQKDISLTRDFFSGTPCAVDVHVQVITERNSNDIINQYILFSQIITEQIRLHGRTSKAVVETFRICRDKNVLKEFLRKHEKEVANIMIQFYSQREAMEDYGRSMKREGRDEHARQTAARMYKRGMSLDEVADILDVDVQQVKSWLGFAIVK